jgi:hypothetical protein
MELKVGKENYGKRSKNMNLLIKVFVDMIGIASVSHETFII